MSAPRTIAVALTEQQYLALAGAVASREGYLAELRDEGDDHARRSLDTLDRAWAKVNRAWYARERKARA